MPPFFTNAVRSCERFFADRIEHCVHIFGNVFKSCLRVINRDVGAELLEQVLVCRRCGGDDAGAPRFGDLHRETTDTA